MDKRVFNRLDKIEEYLDNDPESEVCIMFPEATYIKTKRGKIGNSHYIVQNTNDCVMEYC